MTKLLAVVDFALALILAFAVVVMLVGVTEGHYELLPWVSALSLIAILEIVVGLSLLGWLTHLRRAVFWLGAACVGGTVILIFVSLVVPDYHSPGSLLGLAIPIGVPVALSLALSCFQLLRDGQPATPAQMS